MGPLGCAHSTPSSRARLLTPASGFRWRRRPVATHPDWSQYRSVRVDEWLPGVVRSAVPTTPAAERASLRFPVGAGGLRACFCCMRPERHLGDGPTFRICRAFWDTARFVVERA